MHSRFGAAIAIAAAFAVWTGSGALSARAGTVVINDQVQVQKSEVTRPPRGVSMSAVEAKFGAPRLKHPTVGTPPITRWDYADFAVFFEKDRVIDAVVPAPPSQQTDATSSEAAQTPADGTETAPELPASQGAAAQAPVSSGPANSGAPQTQPEPPVPATPTERSMPIAPAAPATSIGPPIPAAQRTVTVPAMTPAALPAGKPSTATAASPPP